MNETCTESDPVFLLEPLRDGVTSQELTILFPHDLLVGDTFFLERLDEIVDLRSNLF